ncbi:MAG: peroxiredoxin [Gemmataceae bacterium]
MTGWRWRWVSPICVGLLVCVLAASQKPASAPESRTAPLDFQLPDVHGRLVSASDFRDRPVVVVAFLGTECPLVNLYMPRLCQLSREYGPRGVQFVGINSNEQDDIGKIIEHVKCHNVPFPMLKDKNQKVADLFQAKRVPEVFVLDRNRQVVYRGRIDDQYGIGYQKVKPERQYLKDALEKALAGKEVSERHVPAVGCFIGRSKPELVAGSVTYTREVSRIIQKHCQECHRPGHIGPFSLLTYEKTRAWAETIREVVAERRMPPWHADPRYGKFANDRSMPEQDRATLLAWIDQGCPKGDERDLPPPREFPDHSGWRIGKPDVVFELPQEVEIPAEAPNGVPYLYFAVPTHFTEDKWVQFAEARPGNKLVVHHIIVYIRSPGQPLQRSEDLIGNNLLVGYAPGDLPAIFPDGMAKRIPKGSTLIFQMHYTPNGTPQKDRSSVGLIFAKELPRHIVRTRSILNRRFAIPPGHDHFRVQSSSTFTRDAYLLSFMPHMHLRGKSFEYKVVYPDGRAEIVLYVPRYDFGWQTQYRLEKPLFMPAGTRIECTAHFDNSPNNPNNPDPTKTVFWGEQTWEEMMIGWVDYYYADEKPNAGVS